VTWHRFFDISAASAIAREDAKTQRRKREEPEFSVRFYFQYLPSCSTRSLWFKNAFRDQRGFGIPAFVFGGELHGKARTYPRTPKRFAQNAGCLPTSGS